MSQFEDIGLYTKGGEPVLFKGAKINGRLEGLLFEATVEQRFVNSESKNVEVVYTFPLPWGATLLGVDVTLGGVHLSGKVVNKNDAELGYENALSEGHAAVMLERNGDSSYTLNLGNLAPGETCTIGLRYAQILAFEQHGVRLIIPTVIAPRYGDPILDAGLKPHQVVEPSLTAEHPLELELRLVGELARGRVGSPSHPITLSQVEGREDRLVELGRGASLDRDFILIIDQLQHDSMAVVAKDYVTPDKVVALLSFCPRLANKAPEPLALKMLVDCSGSMAGDSITAAKRALLAIVEKLAPHDRFTLSRFGSDVVHRSRGFWTTTEATRHAAQRWVADLEADLGGTRMESALRSTFALSSGAASDVLLVTDGDIHAVEQTIRTAVAAAHRIFVVGIGSSPSENFLRRLAYETGGACDFVAPGEAVEPAVLRMFARLHSPRVANLTLQWPSDVQPKWTTALPITAFDGDTIHVFAKFSEVPQGQVRLVACGATEVVIASARIEDRMESAGTLSRVAAATRIRNATGPRIRRRARKLAVRYQIVTDETNFLLVNERGTGEAPMDMPELHQVRPMRAAGWGGNVAIWRSGRGMESAHVSALHIAGFMDVPAFSFAPSDFPSTRERGALQFVDAGDQGVSVDRNDPRLWQMSDTYTGLTPAGLHAWLFGSAKALWPRTYAQLIQIGVGAAVIDWLEIVVACATSPTASEGEVVSAFVDAMSRVMLFENDPAQTIIDGEIPTDLENLQQIAMAITEKLRNIKADSWPQNVLTLESQESPVEYACERK